MTLRSLGLAVTKSLSGKSLLSKSLLLAAVLGGLLGTAAPAARANIIYECRRPVVYSSYPVFRHRIFVERARIRRMEWREHARFGYRR